MPVTPFLTAPDTPRSARIYNNEECRNNALKSRRENDWFSHSESPAKLAATSHVSPQFSNEQHRISRPSSARWWSEDTLKVARHGTPESKKIQEKLEAVNQEEWYKHGSGVADPLPPSKNKPKTRRSTCSEARAQQASSDTNNWFRHEHASTGTTSAVSPSVDSQKGSVASCRRNKEFASCMPWLLKESSADVISSPSSPPKRAPCPFEIDDGSPVETIQRGNTRIISPDANSYDRRNKEGTASQWYMHDLKSPPQSHVSQQPRKPVTTNRLTTESEDWYSFRGVYDKVASPNGSVKYKMSPEYGPSSTVATPGSNDQLDHYSKSFDRMDLDGLKRLNEEISIQGHSKTNSQAGNGYKNFVRIDDYVEPMWSVLVDDSGVSEKKY